VVYLEQPEGYVILGKEDHVCLLYKELYGLKQSPSSMPRLLESESAQCVYVYVVSNRSCNLTPPLPQIDL